MNYIPRHIDSALAEWAQSESHKPLLLRGAWQVGKSSAIRNMAQMFDYLLTLNEKVVPWEVKAGTSGKMKTLRVFMNKSGHSLAVRSSLENFAHLDVLKYDGSLYYVKIIPLYALSNLH